MPRWFFNAQSGKCEKFYYSGCGGNENNFRTEAECRKMCSVVCPSLELCDIKCEYGQVLDKDGCPTCECIDPCKVGDGRSDGLSD